MKLSIVIVNYNVRHFLDQCLASVFHALEGIDGEVIVIDNASSDDSVPMLRERYADRITLIVNTDNPGFSKANNQGIAIAKGEYVLLLNPDTLVAADSFSACIDFMDTHPDAGGLGVKMIDGTGTFLPESKRALPTPWVSFYKIFGLSALFPRSKTFARYHLTYLSADENHEIEILSGAYMWMRKSVLEQIGYLDETFFMYGEDVDLSYRIILGGYKNYYVADTQILHYKGESTKKGSLNYVRVFYQAMIIFAKKHFAGRQQQWFIQAIRLAVYVRALMAIGHRLASRFGFAAIEAVGIISLIQIIKNYWEWNVKYVEGGHYPDTFDWIAAPVYTLVFTGLLWGAGAYRKPYRIRPLVAATLSGFVAIATVSYLFPAINFSRAIVGLTSIFTLLMTIASRGLIHWRSGGSFFFSEPRARRVLVMGDPRPAETEGLIRNDWPDAAVLVGHLPADADPAPLIPLLRADELVFCESAALPMKAILAQLPRLGSSTLTMRIRQRDCDFVVSPHEVVAAGGGTAHRRRMLTLARTKRTFDLIASTLLLFAWPLLLPFWKAPVGALRGLWQAARGHVSLVAPGWGKRGLLPMPTLPGGLADTYRNHYTWETDLWVLRHAWRSLGAD